MNIEERIKEDMIKALKEKETKRLTVIRMIKGSADLEHINTKKEITDDLYIDVINKQIKMRNDSITEFSKGGREDLVEQNKEEIDILMNYLPEQLSEEEVIAIIDEAFNEIKPTGMKEMGQIIQNVTPKVKGKTDMKTVSDIIKERLSNL